MQIQKIIKKYIDTFFIVHKDNKAYVLLYKPYQPFKDLPEGYVNINAFYPASNELYFISKHLEGELCEYGASIYKGNLKALFVDSKCAILLKNCLIAIPPYGTRVALSAMELQSVIETDLTNGFIGQELYCDTCDNCIIHCPTGALNEGFNKEICLRYASDHVEETEVDLTLLHKSILGCDACQDICPYNKDIGKIDMPEKLMKLLKTEDLIARAEGGRKYLEELCQFVGNNYNRPNRILKLARIAKNQDVHLDS